MVIFMDLEAGKHNITLVKLGIGVYRKWSYLQMNAHGTVSHEFLTKYVKTIYIYPLYIKGDFDTILINDTWEVWTSCYCDAVSDSTV